MFVRWMCAHACVCVSQTVQPYNNNNSSSSNNCVSLLTVCLSACLCACLSAYLHVCLPACVLAINISATSVSVRCTVYEKQSGGGGRVR